MRYQILKCKFHFTLILGLLLMTSCNAASKYPDGLYAVIHTSKGKIVAQLEFEKAPLTVANFAGLAEGTKNSNKPEGTHFYDGIIFHRVIKGFMIQTGDPEGTGRGGPGYKFADEIHPDLKHSGPGILAMANSGPATNGSQFFITHAATPWLDGKHTVFGMVIEGMKVIDEIAGVEVKKPGDTPLEKIVIEKVEILRSGKKAKAFKNNQAAFDKINANYKKAEEDKNANIREAAQKEVADFLANLEKQHPGKIVTTASGLKYVVLKEGKGPKKPSKGQEITAHYSGKLIDGKEFDSSYKRGEPIKIPIGAGRVIPGWDEALMDMVKGEKRILVLPPQLGYGPRAMGPIPANANLIFEVELVDF
jgi:cyclophilin family peptidyl-prolyl cis-trans isomerase